jgi:hypothetical protein
MIKILYGKVFVLITTFLQTTVRFDKQTFQTFALVGRYSQLLRPHTMRMDSCICSYYMKKDILKTLVYGIQPNRKTKNNYSSAASQIPCVRMLELNPGMLQRLHWQSGALIINLDLMDENVENTFPLLFPSFHPNWRKSPWVPKHFLHVARVGMFFDLLQYRYNSNVACGTSSGMFI